MRTRFDQYPLSFLALSLLALLLAVYCLIYSGTFISDDEHILTTRTISLAFDGYMNDSRVIGNGRVFSYANSSPTYAAQGLNIEPGQAAAASFLARLALLLGTGNVQTIFLLNIWVTALTAVVLLISVYFLGYSRLTAFLSALLFGIGTIAWPYTQTYYRDVLAMFFITLTWACAFFLVSHKGEKDRSKKAIVLSWFFLFLSLFAGILTKNTILLVVPVLVAYYRVSVVKIRTPIKIKVVLVKNWKILICALGIVVLLFLVWNHFLSPNGILARFSLTYYILVINKFLTTPHPNFWEAVFGPLFSPGKSLFLYSPILLLSIVGLFKRWQLAWPGWAFLLMLILGQALFYDGAWWGHINWGLRYLLPVIPLLMIAAAPAIEYLLETKKRLLLLIWLGSISILMQWLGVLVPTQNYFVDLYDSTPPVSESMAIWNPAHSPITWHFNWIASGQPLGTAAVRTGGTAIPLIVGIFLLVGIIVLGLARIKWPGLPVLSLLISVAITIMIPFIYRDDPAYHRSRKDLEGSIAYITQHALPDDGIYLKSYGTPAWYYWMNWAGQNLQWTSLPYYYPSQDSIDEYNETNDLEIVLDEMTLALLEDVPNTYWRIWLIIPGDSPGADLDYEVAWLETRANSTDIWNFIGDNSETKLFLFTFSPYQPNP
ncbi:MAG: hypothetical protein PVF83_13630 [Anaerolineales bacterium]|jgi:hypothetical protein